MLVLALDTATPTLVVGLARWSAGVPAEVLAETAVESGNRHAELLTPAVRAVLADAGVGMAELGAVVTGLGPGPFTGLRVGIVTAAALADARGLPVVGVCSLDAVGTGARSVVTDARRKEVYWAGYDADGTRVAGPGVDRPEDAALSDPVVGDPGFAERLGRPVQAAAVTTAGLLRAAGPQLASGRPDPLVPLYLRRPDAVPPAARKAVSQRVAGQ
ncbi:tRNA (adenosine(37)-N6)-threonylcarbamoyltransferase complex dimerization subunit type 1 TsaB [Modestobacter sp. I12A-02628]|uniref:tRNA (Adenosine(37)-N6)-threonylcarbamoyltransferase complex dimerization subunit type 1 TsaB n=1 Tax=Goekera deserti TaxID=2497753 RepID=A0A7K3WB16_9ACTN|nr:tRNA (adenosine(37)-N6)-threonylcarbamoyltransferase complex dimerization subunit type 1 TsaB [Goekera deserti]MPR00229.1 tRNA (adenosine(37)-N6)-threonylcarbamoyltransferase complex dimerization subunit type 1 TsaB [Goekera deserti]NDI49403.1 tRNA (adenosine(37)-N6)-threonylcarbamoyltransferase complex dimerization subunit type 1 TsaB [Goekera deserti]NEL52723.1 tRNA (adenosine(37)-N6)-threonylcarbamoyltransferase complex dimerization subunit type 1 TsaB [Goekera deserti]